MLAACIWNVNGGHKGKAMKPSDFFGFSAQPSANGRAPRKVEQTDQAVVDGWLAWAEACRKVQQQRTGKH